MIERRGFVSNSSSSSFIVRYEGVEISLEVYEEEREKLEEMLNKMVESKIVKNYKEGNIYDS
jgi:hypothetical protein